MIHHQKGEVKKQNHYGELYEKIGAFVQLVKRCTSLSIFCHFVQQDRNVCLQEDLYISVLH